MFYNFGALINGCLIESGYLSLFSLNFSLAGKGPFFTSKVLRKSQTFPAGWESLDLGQKPMKKLLVCSASKGISQHI